MLVRIEVCDFKSYRGRQVIGPFRTFTSVIGPNGAGKSNLMDAISFVLGVKSAQLRSSQLKDLVYRGRRLASEDPSQDDQAGAEEEGEGEGEGSAQKAWVLAVYEDADQKEWRFQRTIWTTGNSEYKLNGKVVTYATYNTALTAHNILVKAKNFLVFQGDVEAVAAQAPKELTRLIEQISGSLELEKEYERARDAQERATENAAFNFNKRRGIAGEIKQYKEQKNEADKFERMAEERDELVLQRLLWKLWHIEEGLERNAREIKGKNKELEGLRAEHTTRDQDFANFRTELAHGRSGIIREERRIKRAEQSLEAKRPALLEIDTRIAHSTRKIEKAGSLSEQVERDVQNQEKKVADLQQNLAETRSMADAAAAEAQAQAEQGAALSQESLEEYRRLKARANVLAVEERQSLETLTRDEKTSKRALAQLREKQDGLTQRRERLLEDERVQEEKQDDLQETVGRLQTELAEAKQRLDNYQAEQAKNEQLEKELNEKLHDVYGKMLQAGVEKQESEREAKLKETLANLQRIFPGVRGRVVDLCQPTARKYETAVSVILGRNIDAVVVDEERTAIECIEYMRNQRAGQATFIPLNTIQVNPINEKFRSFARGSRLAIDVISFDAAVERAIHHACGNALICDTMEIARYVCYERKQEVKAVTLEGTVIHKSGLITGGRSTHGSGKKWDDKEVQELPRVRDRLMAQLREVGKNKASGKLDENLLGEVNRLESSLTVARDDLSACDLRLKGIKEELIHIKKEFKATAPALTKAEKEHAALLSRIEELQVVIDEAEDGVFADFCADNGLDNIRQYEQRQLKVAEQESEARVRFETQIARLTHQARFEEEQLQLRKQRLETLRTTSVDEEVVLNDLRQQKEDTQSEIQDAESALETLREHLQTISQIQEEKNAAAEIAKRAASKASKALDAALKEITAKNDEIEKLAMERSSAYRKCRLENIPLPLAQGSLRNVPMEETIRDEMAMDVDEDGDNTQQPKAVADYGVEVDFDMLDEEDRKDGSADRGEQYERDIAEKSAEIERMAPNMKAVERLEDVETKLLDTEKEAQKTRNDSKSARDKFNEIKKKRCDLFNQAYAHISERIDQVYKDLTKGKAAPMGGVAYLTLENDEEPFLGGVKYHAMPPMKRFRDMDQLSGGEKTVAALALLFAIHSYKPSPFFVLDEVDAALDNTNVAKIANYIRSHASEAFQFIVISLKGSLYERGQSLVGIYRDQEVNSSRTLTLDLTQYDE